MSTLKRTAEQVENVRTAALNLEEGVGDYNPDRAYAAGVNDALAWLLGEVRPRVFRGFSPAMQPLLDAAEAPAQPAKAIVAELRAEAQMWESGEGVAAGQPAAFRRDIANSLMRKADRLDAADKQARPAEPVEPAWTPLDQATNDVSELRVRLSSLDVLDADDVDRIGQAVGYAWSAEVRGESLVETTRTVADREGEGTVATLTFYADSTKSRSSDVSAAFDRFLSTLSRTLSHGSPVRKTNRSGPAGTRLVEPVPPFATVYVDAR